MSQRQLLALVGACVVYVLSVCGAATLVYLPGLVVHVPGTLTLILLLGCVALGLLPALGVYLLIARRLPHN